MDFYFHYFVPLLKELCFWSIFAGFILVIKEIIINLNRRELFGLSLIMIAGLLIRWRYSLFFPWHEHDHYIDIILNIYHNYQNGNFLSTPYVYPASGGLYEHFYHKIIFFFPVFHVYIIYWISLFISLANGLFLFNLAKIFFNNKNVAFLSILVYFFLPIAVLISATECMFIFNSFIFLLFLNILILAGAPNKTSYYLLFPFIFTANLLARRETAVFFILFSAILFIIILINSDDLRKKFVNRRSWQILAIICFLLSSLFIKYVLMPNLAIANKVLGINSILLLPKDLTPFEFFNNRSPSVISFLKNFITPLYFYLFYLFSFFVFFKKKYSAYFILYNFLLVMIVLIAGTRLADNIRKFYYILPLLSLQVAYGIHVFISYFSKQRKILLAASAFLVIFSFWANDDLLRIVPAKKIEQELILNNVNKIPDGSLLVTIAEKKYENTKFSKNHKYQTKQHGLEFPSYLLAGRNIDIMDVYQEYDPEIIKKYNSVFYYKSLYAHHENAGPAAADSFEKDYKYEIIEEKNFINHDFDVFTVQDLIDGRSESIKSDEKFFKIGFYRVIKE